MGWNLLSVDMSSLVISPTYKWRPDPGPPPRENLRRTLIVLADHDDEKLIGNLQFSSKNFQDRWR